MTVNRFADTAQGADLGLDGPIAPTGPGGGRDAGLPQDGGDVEPSGLRSLAQGQDFGVSLRHGRNYVQDCTLFASTNAQSETHTVVLSGGMSDEAEEAREIARAFMRQALEVTGWKPYRLAKAAGLAPSTITRPLNDPEFKFTPKQTTLAKIGQAAALTPPKLPEPSATVQVVNRRVPLVGEVRAGAWTEIPDEPYVEDEIPVFLPDYDRASLFALRVAGKSMDLLYPDGCVVIAGPTAEIGLRVGDIAVVRRRRAGLAETTLKEIVQETDGSYSLYPRSSDPSFQPIPLDDERHSDDGPEIIGVVVYSIDPTRRGRGPLVRLT